MPETEEVSLLVEKLLEIGGRSSNTVLRSKLGWSKEKYYNIRNMCRALGLVGSARGRGGVVFLTDTAKTTSADAAPGDASAAKEEEEYAKEFEYYDKLLPTIKRDWVESEGFDDSVVELTASKRVRGAGRWTVPDIVIVGKIVRQYVPGFEFTVQSIEVKRFESADALSVFEALNHRRAAHYSFLLIVNFPKKPTDKENERFGQISQLCEEHEVGLVVVKKGDELDYEAWEFPVEISNSTEPDPYNLDGFIKQYMSPESKDAVAKMVR
ncbi:hypothetical protein [Asticcacaulis sp.]|uniref:hypothetical protein n=1 Tax=Asticcacaulis sp. TaxID=1872648 RepID=UPI00262E2143|nr:hypothetical protein [Asticcacaulis sp.]